MNLRQRIELLGRLGDYMLASDQRWLEVKERAYAVNPWFTPTWIDLAVQNIVSAFLQPSLLEAWVGRYASAPSRNIGIVMAGNIPLVGFHDFLCVFVSGHTATIKLSSKDNVLLPHLVSVLDSFDTARAASGGARAASGGDRDARGGDRDASGGDRAAGGGVRFSEMLRGCDAYIATGSNNSSRYFEQYFGKFPSIIRRNRTSVAILNGRESQGDLDKLADDIQTYFGLGCRNVTKIYVPEGYDFLPLLDALRKYSDFFHHSKYRNNYDYQLAIYIMNNRFYMTNDSIVLVEEKGLFSPIGTLYYEYYKYDPLLLESTDIQCITGEGFLPFGETQKPRLDDYADGVDTMAFLSGL